MYEDFFGFDRRPFSLTPDPEFLFWTDQHRLAFDLVCMSLLRRAPVAVITGDVGAGKTTLVQALLHEISRDFEVALLSNVVGDSGDLLRWILTAFGEESRPSNRAEAMREVEALLGQFLEEGRRSVLIIDEAQNISDHGIETLRLLTNLDVGKCAPLSLIVAGQPELRDRLAGPAFRAFRQRLGASCHLGPMTLTETGGYVRNRIEVAGGAPNVFDDGAVEAVHRRAAGVPRLTNLLCDLCLVAAFAEDRARVEADFAEEALAEGLALGGLGGLAAEAESAVMRSAAAAGAGRGRVHVVAPGNFAAAAARTAEIRRQAAPSLRLVAAGEQTQPEVEAPLLLRGVSGDGTVMPASEEVTIAPAVSPPLPERTISRGRRAWRRGLGSSAGLAAAAAVAGLALILPTGGTDGREGPIAQVFLPAANEFRAAAPAPEQDVAGVVEARLAPPEPQGAEHLFELALDGAANPVVAAIDLARAAARGHGRAAYYLAQMYETGDGVPFAPATAWNWYAVAAKDVSGAGQRLSEIAAMDFADGARSATPVFAAVEGSTVELVWRGRGGSFVVELTPEPGEPSEVIHTTPLTAVRLELPAEAAWWRVRAVGAEPSEWNRIDTPAAY